jgi:hypothetical protein
MVPLATPATAANSRLVMDSPVPVRSMSVFNRSPLTTAYIVGGDSLTFTSLDNLSHGWDSDERSITQVEHFVQGV